MKDEWIQWGGRGECPVGSDTAVEVSQHGRLSMARGLAGNFEWVRRVDGPYVTFYRVLIKAESPQSKPSNPKDLIGVRKVPMSCVPSGVLLEAGLGMLEGASKYGRHNYRIAGVRSSVYFDAAIGHLMDWWEGEDTDAESGLPHITKAITSLMVLRDAQMQGTETDDRPPRSKVHKRDFNKLAGEIIDRHAGKSPRHYTIADDVGGAA